MPKNTKSEKDVVNTSEGAVVPAEVVDHEKDVLKKDKEGHTVTNRTQDTRTKVVNLSLEHDHTINGVKYPAGTREVPAEVAEDLQRADNAHSKYIADLNKNNAVNSNQGTINAS